jgi:5'-nucleotidase
MLALALALTLTSGSPPKCVEILETSDLHGHVTPDTEGGARRGGLAWLAGYVDILRRRANPVLLLDAGDLFQGTLACNLSHGRVMIAGYDALHVDAAVLGNHEFDYGAEAPDADPLAALRHRVAEASFPFLAANVDEKATGALPPWKNLLASKIFEEGGLKVGVIGLSNPETPALTIRAIRRRRPSPRRRSCGRKGRSSWCSSATSAAAAPSAGAMPGKPPATTG